MAPSKPKHNPSIVNGEPRRNFVTAFARGLAVIQCFGPETRAMTSSQIAELTGGDWAVLRRLLLPLIDVGFARLHERRFELTTRVLRLAYSFLASTGLGASLRRPFDSRDCLALRIGRN